MTEQEQALKIANMWLEGQMNALVQMVPGDPDCDACVVARQLIRALEREAAEAKNHD
jgi:DNA-binding FrmR family transcriptional regulator